MYIERSIHNKEIDNMTKMNANLKRLIAIGTLTSITEIYMNTFFTARIFELTGNSIQTVATFYITQYIFIACTFLVMGNKIKSLPLKALRIGILLKLALLIFIMVMDNRIMHYYFPFAIILGIAQGSYYSPFAVLVGTFNDNAVRYCTTASILSNIVKLVFPITIGAYISSTSFASVTICMVVVSGIQIVLSICIKNVEFESKCDILQFVHVLKSSKDYKSVFGFYKISFFNGIVSSVLDRTVLILIMIMFGSALQLGILDTVFAIFTIITTWMMKRFYKQKKSKMLIVLSAIAPMVAVLILLANTNTGTVIFYKIVNSIFICILSLIADIARYDCLSANIKQNFTAEHQMLSEISLALGRIFGLSILLIVSNLIGGLYAIMIMLVLISFSIFAYAYLIIKR